jgi:hypothetical protein
VNRLRAVLCAVTLCAAAACGASSPAAPTPAVAFTVQSIVFAFAEGITALTTAGGTAQVTALGISPTGATRDVTSTCTNWQSDDLSVLSVTSGGVLTAQSGRPGAATITTTCQGVAASGRVPVSPSPVLLPAPPSTEPTTCTNPPYAWDANPNVLRCRESNGRFAPSVCCGH